MFEMEEQGAMLVFAIKNGTQFGLVALTPRKRSTLCLSRLPTFQRQSQPGRRSP